MAVERSGLWAPDCGLKAGAAKAVGKWVTDEFISYSF